MLELQSLDTIAGDDCHFIVSDRLQELCSAQPGQLCVVTGDLAPSQREVSPIFTSQHIASRQSSLGG